MFSFINYISLILVFIGVIGLIIIGYIISNYSIKVLKEIGNNLSVLDEDEDEDEVEDEVEDVCKRWERPFQRTGDEDLPYSICMKGKVYRWHESHWIHDSNDFYKMFEDGIWKWTAQGRFAGKDHNCGHYFGLSIAAAREEALHYGIPRESSVLLELEGESSRVLDLTHPDVMRTMFENHVENHKMVSDSYYNMLQELIEKGDGGNSITDYFGYIAKRMGYEAILFYSARALDILNIKMKDRNLEGLTYKIDFYDIRTNPELLNIVFFSGAEVINRTKIISIDGSGPIKNPNFGIGVKAVNKFFKEYDSHYQMERDRIIIPKPSYLPSDV